MIVPKARILPTLVACLICQSTLATASIVIEDLQGALALVGMRNLALEMAEACMDIGETASGEIALGQFKNAWKDRYRDLDRKIDEIYDGLPDRPKIDMERAVRARLKISVPFLDALALAPGEERQSMCSSVATTFMPFATLPETMLRQLGTRTSIERILAIRRADIERTANVLRKNYRTPEAFKDQRVQ